MSDQLTEALQNLSQKLPKGWIVQICIEHGAGWAHLIRPHNELIGFSALDGSFAAGLESALNYARDNPKCQN